MRFDLNRPSQQRVHHLLPRGAQKAAVEFDLLSLPLYMIEQLPRILEDKLYIDPKSRFQEAAQEHTGITPSYKVLSEEGPDHQKEFEIAVYLGKEKVATGKGTSKHEAQVTAAQNAIDLKGW